MGSHASFHVLTTGLFVFRIFIAVFSVYSFIICIFAAENH